MDAHIIHEGIEQYGTADSSLGLCTYLTVREGEENTPGNYQTLFVNKYKYKDAFYRYEEYYFNGYCKETVVLALTYEEEDYKAALIDVKSQPGFSNDISFEYGNYEFYLNSTEKIAGEKKAHQHGRENYINEYVFTDYKVNGDEPYLHWINLVGYSTSKKTLAFVGFYYEKKWRSGFWKYDKSYYSFEGWNKLFETEFSFFEWING